MQIQTKLLNRFGCCEQFERALNDIFVDMHHTQEIAGPQITRNYYLGCPRKD